MEYERAKLDELRGRRFDLAVVGGGINGAGIAQEAASRGLRVLLAEQADFGSGTTWRSTKLIHGGLRYLEHGELRLVFESLRERKVLLRLAPGQVRPLRFLLPVYRGYRRHPALIRLGLTLYDLLSLGSGLPGHRQLSSAELARLEPSLAQDGLKGGFSYYDGQALYPERLCLEYVLAARRAGAETLNHCEVTAIDVQERRARGLQLRDRLSGVEAYVEAKAIVNAAGPWVDTVLQRTGRTVPRQIGGTRGSHIMVDYAGRGPRHAIYSEAGQDNRPFFIVPWRALHLIGTTDLRFQGNPEGVLPSDEEIAYLVREANRRLPDLRLATDDVLYAYTGIRPLPYTAGGAEGSITRRHIIRDHARDGLAGLYSILGGKLSTFRSLARQAVERIAAQEKLALRTRQPAGQPFALDTSGVEEYLVDRQDLRFLSTFYGARTAGVLRLVDESPSLGARLCSHGPEIAAQVVYAVREELAVTAGDVLLRRIGSGWNACLGLDCAAEVARVLLQATGRDQKDGPKLVEEYRTELAATVRSPAAGLSPGEPLARATRSMSSNMRPP
ncbi:MAG: glycerol-3-phosphate dehydrogenase/oxidase [Dehalococcoidia bacterium]